MARIDLKQCTLTIKDGTSNNIEVSIGSGTLEWTEHHPREYLKDRGTLDTVRNGEEEPLDIRFDFAYEYVKNPSGSGDPTPYEALTQTGQASSWTSTDSDTCQPYAVDLEFEWDPNCSGSYKEKLTFSLFRVEEISANPADGQISVTGKCNTTAPTVTATAIT